MRLDVEKIKEKGLKCGLSLRSLLNQAGVSRTAYYHLTRASTLVPTSLHKIAQVLNLQVSEILLSTTPAEEQYHFRLSQLERAMRHASKANRENIWHTLILLEQKPIERLRGALRRSRR